MGHRGGQIVAAGSGAANALADGANGLLDVETAGILGMIAPGDEQIGQDMAAVVQEYRIRFPPLVTITFGFRGPSNYKKCL